MMRIFKQANHSQTAQKIRKQEGFIAELMIAMAIFAILGIAAIVVVPPALAKHRASSLGDELNVAIPNIQNGMSRQSGMANLTTAMVARNHWINESYIEFDSSNSMTGNLVTPWGSMTILPVSSGQEGQITITSVPSVACTKFAEYLGSNMYTKATIGGVTVKDVSTSSTVDLNAVGSQCNASSTTTITANFPRA